MQGRKLGHEVSVETRIKISKAKIGRIPWNKGKKGIYSDEQLLKWSIMRKGKPSGRKGVCMSDENKEKLRLANLGSKHPERSAKTKGMRAWNKGLPRYWVANGSFKKGQTIGIKNVNWSGDFASYGSLHKWVYYHKGRPYKCEHCGVEGLNKYQYQWANTNHKYKRNLEDYLRLCAKCHRKYDKQYNGYKRNFMNEDQLEVKTTEPETEPTPAEEVPVEVAEEVKAE